MLSAAREFLRRRLGPNARRRARGMADLLLAPIGSINRVDANAPLAALTFDDGPDPSVTPGVLDALAAQGMHATFFLLTERACENPALVARILAEGHEVGLHFDVHDALTQIPLLKARRRLIAARRVLEDLIGRPVSLFRPPFGAQSLATFLLARWVGLSVVAWGPYAGEWRAETPEAAVRQALDRLEAGSILLLHDGLEVPEGDYVPTFDRVEMVRQLLDALRARGLRGASVGELMAAGRVRRTAWFREGPAPSRGGAISGYGLAAES